MALADELTRVHDRIDEVLGQVSSMNVTFTSFAAKAEGCRRIVMGNGGDSIDKRVDRLETAKKRETRRESFWAGALIGLLTAVAGAVAGYFLKGG